MYKFRIKKRTKKLFKVIAITILVIILLVIFLSIIFKPVYEVKYKNEFMGYTKNLINIDKQIEEELKKGGDGITYYDLEEPISYDVKLMKLGTKLDYDIIEMVKENAIPVYRYYTVTQNGEEIGFFKNYNEAVSLIDDLRKKDKKLVDNIDVSITYRREKQEYTNRENLASYIYEQKKLEEKREREEFQRSSKNSTGVSYRGLVYSKKELPIDLESPLKGPITSKFQPARTIFGRTSPHSGVDIGRETGTPIRAAQTGYVTVSGVHGPYGNFVCIDHSKEVSTCYAHLSKRLVSIGDFVKQGEVIGYVGTTGRSTGPHLHFEVRYNGVAYNPEFYVSFN